MREAQVPTPVPPRAAWRGRRHLWQGRGRRNGVGRPRADVAHPTRIRLWLPLTPLWVLLAPFALLLSPLLALTPAARTVNPLKAAFAIGAVLLSMSGTVVDVDAPGATIRIRIF